ncbi:MAG: hypothetical protein ACLQVI_05295 [Polyangiaceae bacterium]
MYRDSEIGVIFHHGVLSRSAFPLRLAQGVSFLFSLVYAALATRFLLEYVQAPASRFGYWVGRVTDVAYVPLRVFFRTGHDPAGHPVAWALLVAIVAFAVVQWSLVSWLRDVARPTLEED